ncbi:CRISP [Desmophyllum pertusum]|uniref:CRISP n=1 Tax=Desmophyllum pertusum TaxID=174260 RepID=A0A9X0A3M3_9CNID|nr:CRISP [Desmophyllum pertusum]
MIVFSNLGFLGTLMIFIVIVHNTGSLNCKQQSLTWHNYYRRIHQVGDVTWSFQLLKKAKNWANYLAENNLFKHESSNQGNLYLSSGQPKEPCAEAVMLFYGEEKNYDYKKPGATKSAGHFTQVVWKSTKQIGAFSAIRKDGKTVVVFKYNPRGNVGGYYAKNVFPPRKPTTVTSPTPITNVTAACNATYGNFTTTACNFTNVRAGVTSVKAWRVAQFALQWLLIGLLMI